MTKLDTMPQTPDRNLSAASEALLAARDKSDGITLSEAVRHLWSGRVWISGVTLLGLCLGLVLVTIAAIRNPSVNTYRSAIALTMLGAKPGEYPNGTQFAVSDLRSPAVLDKVYENSKLTNYGIKKNEFFKSIIIESYSPNVDSISSRFRLKSQAKNITAEEIKALEESYRTELSSARSDGILITFAAEGGFGIPDTIGKLVVKDIAASWSEIFTRSLGVTAFPVAKSDADLIDTKLIADLDYPLVFDYIDKSAKDLDSRLKEISNLPNANNLVLEQESQTLFDLQRRSQAIRLFQLDKVMRPIIDKGLSKQSDLTVLAYENQSQLLKIGEGENTRNSAAISSLIRERNATESNSRQQADGQQAGASGAGGQVAGMSTINNDVVDKIVALSVSSAGAEFREGLLKEKLDIEKRLADDTKQSELLLRRVSAIKSLSGLDLAAQKNYTKAFSDTLALTVSELNQIWKSGNSLLEVLNFKRLNEDKLLYSDIPIDRSVIKYRFYNSMFNWILLFGLTLIFMIIGLVSFLVRKAIQN